MGVSMSKHNKVAMITGAASGIGREVARRLAQEGCDLCLIDLNEELLEQLKIELETSTQIAIYTGDVTNHSFIQHVVQDIQQNFGRLDFALNNAGVTTPANAVTDISIEEWHRVMNINVNSLYYCMHYQIPLMLKNSGGSIVNMSSMLGLIATKNRAPYVTSKHAVTGMTKAVALDYAEQNIR